MEKICVLGAGSWGTALAIVLADNGHDVCLYLRDPNQAEEMNRTRRNQKYLGDIALPQNIRMETDIAEAVQNADALVLAVSSQATRSVIQKFAPYLSEQTKIINVSKGLEKGSNQAISEISNELFPQNPFIVLSGPSHAEEVAVRMPTVIVAASKELTAARYVQDLFSNEYLRVYTNPDVIGVELGGALKNIIAFGVGVIDGLGYGDNTKAAIMTRGIVEITRLGVKLGADLDTFTGLSGIGDLIVTCTSKHSRNRRAGVLIGQGKSLDEVLKEVQMVVEGVIATKVAYDLSLKLGVTMPITTEIYRVLYEGKDVKQSIKHLMSRDKKHEIEESIGFSEKNKGKEQT